MGSPFKKPKDSLLDLLGISFNCDKSSQNRKQTKDQVKTPGHDVLRKYELFLNGYLLDPNFTMMELGAGPLWNIGASLKIWLEFFPNAKEIKIVDIKPEAKDLCALGENVKCEIGDLGNIGFIKSLKGSYDFIIDDASHFHDHQIKAFCTLFNFLKKGGVYIIEDIHTSFGDLKTKYNNPSQNNWNKLDAFSYLILLSSFVAGKGRSHQIMENFTKNLQITLLDKEENHYIQLLDNIHKKIDSIMFVNHSCIIVKK